MKLFKNILNSRQNRSKNKLVPELVTNQISHSYEQTVACDVMLLTWHPNLSTAERQQAIDHFRIKQ